MNEADKKFWSATETQAEMHARWVREDEQSEARRADLYWAEYDRLESVEDEDDEGMGWSTY